MTVFVGRSLQRLAAWTRWRAYSATPDCWMDVRGGKEMEGISPSVVGALMLLLCRCLHVLVAGDSCGSVRRRLPV